jgi:cytochrome c556
MKALLCGLTALVIMGLLQANAEEAAPTPKKDAELSVWMDVKIKESQKIFVALARADYDAIIESTRKLKTLSEIEGFVRRRAPGYLTQLRSFEFAVDDIRQSAKQKNIEGVTLGFNQLTLSCVNCHKQIRGN